MPEISGNPIRSVGVEMIDAEIVPQVRRKTGVEWSHDFNPESLGDAWKRVLVRYGPVAMFVERVTRLCSCDTYEGTVHARMVGCYS